MGRKSNIIVYTEEGEIFKTLLNFIHPVIMEAEAWKRKWKQKRKQIHNTQGSGSQSGLLPHHNTHCFICRNQIVVNVFKFFSYPKSLAVVCGNNTPLIPWYENHLESLSFKRKIVKSPKRKLLVKDWILVQNCSSFLSSGTRPRNKTWRKNFLTSKECQWYTLTLFTTGCIILDRNG